MYMYSTSLKMLSVKFDFFLLWQSYVMFGEREDLEMFKEIYGSIMKYLKKGYIHVNAGYTVAHLYCVYTKSF